MKETLLQKLAAEAQTSYLSDLHSQCHRRDVYIAVCKLSPDKYPLDEWMETVEYITGENGRYFSTPNAAFQFLKQELTQPTSRKT